MEQSDNFVDYSNSCLPLASARHIPCYYSSMRLTALLAASVLAITAVSARADGNVVVLEIKGGIRVATAEYTLSGIEHADASAATPIIIDMYPPGGLMAPMRDIVQAILGSSVPVATYVTPAGARADSAGTYILLASHIAVMTPTTHLGAATPVSLGGDDATPSTSDDEETDDDADGPPSGTAMER